MSETVTTNGTAKGAADRLREHVAGLETSIVDVKAPSGFVYRIRKPSKFGMLFEMAELPQATASEAVEKWIEDGVYTPGEDERLDEAVNVIDKALSIIDRVAELSHEPKLILSGTPANDNEILASQIPEGDLEYLCQWVKAGGEASALLAMFPAGSQQSALARLSRKKRGNKAKRVSGS